MEQFNLLTAKNKCICPLMFLQYLLITPEITVSPGDDCNWYLSCRYIHGSSISDAKPTGKHYRLKIDAY